MPDQKTGIVLAAAAAAIYLVVKASKAEAKEPPTGPPTENIIEMGEIHVEWV